MPRRTIRRHKRKMRGGSFMSFIRKAHNFIKKNKIISKTGRFLGDEFSVPYASKIGSVAGKLGYGRRCGGSLRIAGGRRKRTVLRRR